MMHPAVQRAGTALALLAVAGGSGSAQVTSWSEDRVEGNLGFLEVDSTYEGAPPLLCIQVMTPYAVTVTIAARDAPAVVGARVAFAGGGQGWILTAPGPQATRTFHGTAGSTCPPEVVLQGLVVATKVDYVVTFAV